LVGSDADLALDLLRSWRWGAGFGALLLGLGDLGGEGDVAGALLDRLGLLELGELLADHEGAAVLRLGALVVAAAAEIFSLALELGLLLHVAGGAGLGLLFDPALDGDLAALAGLTDRAVLAADDVEVGLQAIDVVAAGAALAELVEARLGGVEVVAQPGADRLLEAGVELGDADVAAAEAVGDAFAAIEAGDDVAVARGEAGGVAGGEVEGEAGDGDRRAEGGELEATALAPPPRGGLADEDDLDAEGERALDGLDGAAQGDQPGAGIVAITGG
jgi:hypothetical protein